MASLSSIYDNLRANSSYSSVSDDDLHDIAYNLYIKSSYTHLSALCQRMLDPYISSIFAGDNQIWLQFTYTEIIQMEEDGVNIPEEVLQWAHSMQDADTTTYDTSDTNPTDDDLSASDMNKSQYITLKKLAKALIEDCQTNESDITLKLENLNTLKKDSLDAQKTAEDTQKNALTKMQELVVEWKNLDSKVKRGVTLSETERERFNELSGLLNQKNTEYQKDMKNINVDFEEIAASLFEIDSMITETSELATQAESVGAQLASVEKSHKFVSTNTNSIPISSETTLSALSKNLGQTTLEQGQSTFTFANDTQVTVNEVASIMDITNEVTTSYETEPDIGITESDTENSINTAGQKEENEIEKAESSAENQIPKSSTTTVSAATLGGGEISGGVSKTEVANVEETAEANTDNDIVEDTLATDNEEELESDLKTQTQEQINACNATSNAITNTENEVDSLKDAVLDIENEYKTQSKITEHKVNRKLKEYEKICNKIKKGDSLTDSEQQRFDKLSEELDTEDSEYIQRFDDKINTLSTYRSSLKSAIDFVESSFDLAETTIAIGKQLAIEELGDRSYMQKMRWFRLANENRKKDLLYGKAGESLGRDAIDRGELLNNEAEQAQTYLTTYLPIADTAEELETKITQQKNNFVEKVETITKDVPTATTNEDARSKTKDEADEEEFTDDSVKASTSEANKLTSETQEYEEEVEDADKQAVSDKKYAKQAEKKCKAINAKEIKQQENTQKEIDALNVEIEQAEESLDAPSADPEETNEAINTIDIDNNQVVVLVNDSQKATTKAQRDSAKEETKIEKADETNTDAQDKCSKFEKFVNETDEVMSYVTLSGMGLEWIGLGMFELGNLMLSNPFTAAAGLALVTAGGISMDIGAIAETAGTLGTLTCKITKTAIALADGDILGALKNLAIAGAVVGAGAIGKAIGGIGGAAAMTVVKGIAENENIVDANVTANKNNNSSSTANSTTDAAAESNATAETTAEEATRATEGTDETQSIGETTETVTEDAQGEQNEENAGEEEEFTDDSVKASTSKANKLTSETEDYEEETEDADKQAIKDNRYALKAAKKFKALNIKELKQQENTQKEIDALNAEIEQAEESLDAPSADPEETNEAINTIDIDNNQVVVLVNDSQKATTKAQRDSAKEEAKIEKADETNTNAQDKCSKFEKFVNETDEVMSYVTLSGMGLEWIGLGMFELGNLMLSNPFTAAAGLALVTAGGISMDIGAIAETAGTLGTLTCKVTKTAIGLAQGDILGALKNIAIAGAVVGAGAIGKAIGGIGGAAAMTVVKGIAENENIVDANVTANKNNNSSSAANSTTDAAAESNATAETTAEEATRATEGTDETQSIGETTETEENSEEDDLRTQTQEQINACNMASLEIQGAMDDVDPLKKAVENIKKQSGMADKAAQTQINKKLREYETLYKKMKSGEELSKSEDQRLKELGQELDTENGEYVQGLDEKIDILSAYRISLNDALNIVSASFDTADTTIETGKKLAIQELGDRSYLAKSFIFRFMRKKKKKDILYGKPGESLGRDAIDRGELLNKEAGKANRHFKNQIPLAEYAEKKEAKIAAQKEEFTEKVEDIIGNDQNVYTGSKAKKPVKQTNAKSGNSTGTTESSDDSTNNVINSNTATTTTTTTAENTAATSSTPTESSPATAGADTQTTGNAASPATTNAVAQTTTGNTTTDGIDTQVTTKADARRNATNSTDVETNGKSTQETKAATNTEKTEDGTTIDAKNGKQAAKDAQKDGDKTKADTKKTEQDAKEMNKVDQDAQKTDKSLQKDSKTLEKNIQKDEKELEKNEKKVQETSNKIDEETTAMETEQAELENLNEMDEQESSEEEPEGAPADAPAQPAAPQAQGGQDAAAATAATTAVPSPTLQIYQSGAAASSSSGGSTSKNAARIEELNTTIQSRSNKLGLYSGTLTKYQTQSDKIIKRMTKNHKALAKTAKKEEKEKNENMSTSDKVLKVAEKIESVSNTVATVGSIVGLTGDILQKILLPPWIPIIGAVMSPIGHTVEAIGNYGVAAANVTKVAVYAAQGNLMGALMSAGIAAMSAVGAAKATGQATKGFQEMGKNIGNASAKAAAYKATQQAAQQVVTATGLQGAVQQTQQWINQSSVALTKSLAKEGVKQAVKEGTKTLAINSVNMANTFSGSSSDNGEKKKKKANVTLSKKFKEIQRKGRKRRNNIAKAYGMKRS